MSTEPPVYCDHDNFIGVDVSSYEEGRPVGISLPSHVWISTSSARAFAAALTAAADWADANPDLVRSGDL